MADTDIRSVLDDVWGNTDDDEGTTPAVAEMAVVADDEPEVATAATETPAPEAQAAPEAPAPTEAPSLTVDARGVHHRADGTIASKDEVAAFKAAAPPTAIEAPKVEAPVVEAQKVTTPFRYRGAGATHELPGAVLDADGNLTIPRAAVTDVQRLLAGGQQFYSEGHGSFQYVQKLERELSEAKQTRSLSETRSEEVLKRLDPLLSPNVGDEDALRALLKLREEYPTLMRDVEINYWKQEATKGARPQQPNQPDTATQAQTAPSPTQYPDRSTMESTHTEFIEKAKVLSEFREMTDADWTQFTQKVARRMPAYFRPVTTEEAQQLGIPQGTIVYDDELLAEEIVEFQAQRKRDRDIEARLKKANEAGSFNAAQLKGTQPTVAAQKPRTSAPAPQKEQPKTLSYDERQRAHAEWRQRQLTSPGFPDEDE